VAGLRAWALVCGLAMVGGVVGCGDDDGNGSGVPDADSADTSPTEAVCGNGIVEAGEDCDNGPGGNIDGSGCDSDCTFSCHTDADCDDGNECNGEERCSASLNRCQAGTPLADGAECTFMLVPSPTIDGDGGVPDGGATEGEPVPTPSYCIDAECAQPCTEDSECDDGDPCNGEETCNTEIGGACQAGEPPECDDGLECTVDTCDPEENPLTGCVHTLIDEDGDGYAPDHLDCGDPEDDDYRGGDCDDTDPDIHPGADRICGDGIDNNCLGYTHDPEEPIWYQDCDGDGFAAAGALSHQSCDKPTTTEQCIDWVQRTPSGYLNTDCDDTNPDVHPDPPHVPFAAVPYCAQAGTTATGTAPNFTCGVGTLSWDYNCNGHDEPRWEVLSPGCVYSPLSRTCLGDGWAAQEVPDCGEVADYRRCTVHRLSCNAELESRSQLCR
jgi:hypothetical protein